MSTLTVYSSLDGNSAKWVGGSTWAYLRNAASGTFTDSTQQLFAAVSAYGDGAAYSAIYRGFFIFNTSGVGSGNIISSATMSLWGTQITYVGNTPAIDVYLATPASDTSLADGDYSQIGTTSQTTGSIAFTSWTDSSYNTFTFSATGRGNINKAGNSRFGTREVNYDVANNAPNNQNGELYHVNVFSRTYTGTSRDPYLVITYAPPSGPANVKTVNGVASASIKTFNGVTFTSVKTVNGVA